MHWPISCDVTFDPMTQLIRAARGLQDLISSSQTNRGTAAGSDGRRTDLSLSLCPFTGQGRGAWTSVGTPAAGGQRASVVELKFLHSISDKDLTEFVHSLMEPEHTGRQQTGSSADIMDL